MDAWRPLSATQVSLVGRPYLCLSDLRGDAAALDAVLSSVRHLDLAGVVACGNLLAGHEHDTSDGSRPMAENYDPFEVWTRLTSLGAHMTCGPTDLAVATLDHLLRAERARNERGGERGRIDATARQRLLSLERTRDAVGDLVARRLGELPTTLVVSLDDLRGVMVCYSSPVDMGESDVIGLDDDTLAYRMGAVAEDVLVVGGLERPLARRIQLAPALIAFDAVSTFEEQEALAEDAAREPQRELLVVNAGSTAPGPAHTQRLAHAVLVGAGDDGEVHAFTSAISLPALSRRQRTG